MCLFECYLKNMITWTELKNTEHNIMSQTDIVRIIHQRIELYQMIRAFFSEKQVQEVETPILSRFATTDLHIDSFKTPWGNENLYLQTSPEFAMKRLLSMGIGDCYQLCKVFRHEGASKNHKPEFSLLEWYRPGFSMYDLISEVAELVKNLCPDWANLDVEIVSYARVFSAFDINPHQDDLATLKEKIQKHSGFTPRLCDKKDEWLDFFLVTQIEKQLGNNTLTFLTHYPASMAALSQKTRDEQGNEVAERFELYYQGIELANGFYELTDADEQQRRFKADNRERIAIGKPAMPIDEVFIDALKKGVPACSGVALGVDRLLMLKHRIKDINEVML